MVQAETNEGSTTFEKALAWSSGVLVGVAAVLALYGLPFLYADIAFASPTGIALLILAIVGGALIGRHSYRSACRTYAERAALKQGVVQCRHRIIASASGFVIGCLGGYVLAAMLLGPLLAKHVTNPLLEWLFFACASLLFGWQSYRDTLAYYVKASRGIRHP